jgi:8-oxo-dGTP pyrophosphatase MutT (NUDIX family)
MLSRDLLLSLIAHHTAADEKEAEDRARMLTYARTLNDPFSRAELPAHFTASALIVDPDGARVCMVHHKKLARWLQPGGHFEPSDGGDAASAALREAREETSLAVCLANTDRAPIDLDIHVIPARPDMAAHEHLDVRFLLRAADVAATFDPAESLGIRFMPWEEALDVAGDPALVRLLKKGQNALKTPVFALRAPDRRAGT